MALSSGTVDGSHPVAGGRTGGSFNVVAAFIAAFVLLGVGALLVTATESWGLFAFFALPVVALSAFVVGLEVYHCRVNVFRLTVAATVVWYFWPMIAASIPGSPIQLPTDFGGTANSIYVIIMALIPALIASFVFPRPVLQADWMSLARHRHALSIGLILCSLVQTALIVTGKWTYGSLSLHVIQSDKTYLLFMNSLELVTAPFCGAMVAILLRATKGRSLEFWLICVVMAVQLAWAMIGGRRVFATSFIVSGAAFFNVYWRGVPTRQRVIQAIAALGAGLVIVAFAWQAFYMLRVVSYSLRVGQAMPSVSEMYQMAKITDTRMGSVEYRNNLATRGLIINSVVTVVENAHGSLYGQGMLNSSLEAIPSLFFPGKKDFDRSGGGVQEILWADQLGVPLDDYANTLLLDGYADFSIFGLTIYLTILQIFLMVVSYIFRGSAIALTAFGVVFVQYLNNVEASFGAAFSMTRDVTLIVIVAGFIYAAVSGRFSPARRNARPALGPRA